jgi:hypothetical protein
MVQWGLLLAFGTVATVAAGCDDITAGQPGDSSGAPRLVHITVQDARGLRGNAPAIGFVQRNAVVDLLDVAPPPSCSDVDPCVGQFTIDLTAPDFSCSVSGPGSVGTCHDPLHVPAAGVPLSVPLAPYSGDAGSGMQIRIVFDKVLDNRIETVTPDPSKPPGKTNSYVLAPNLVELDGADGKEVPCVKIYDNGGSPSFTSDLMLAPFGPALVLKPKSPLAPSTTYTIRLTDPGALRDRSGNAAVAADGSPLPAPYAVTFTTEPLTRNAAASSPDFGKTPATITPNQIVQLAFWSPVDETTATVALSGPGGAVQARAFADRGSDPHGCAGALNPWLLDLAHTVGAGAMEAPADWPAGDYSLSLTIKDASGASTFSSDTLRFTVAGSADPNDPQGYQSHVTPAQCVP